VAADGVHERAVGDRRARLGEECDVGVVHDVAVRGDDIGRHQAVGPGVLEGAHAVEAPDRRALARAPAEVDAEAQT
jgi:hypothetical protein